MEPKGPKWLGLQVIEASDLRPKGMKTYSYRWRRWVSWCDEMEVSALAATGDDAILWLRHEKLSRSIVSDTRKAVNFVYQNLGMASPFRERVVMREVFPDSGLHGPESEYNWYARDAHRLRVRDYLGWCHVNGWAALPGSGRQVAEFLRTVAEDFSYSMVDHASAGVSRYLEENGCPGTRHHPEVQKVMQECEEIYKNRAPRELRFATKKQRNAIQSQWKEWCDDAVIDWKCAGEDDALRYLRGLEYQRTAALRVHQLSLLYEGMKKNPFSSESVEKWRSEHVRFMKENLAEDWRVIVRTGEVIQELKADKELQPVRLAAGLTLDDVKGLDADLSGEYADSTLRSYSQSYAGFERWFVGMQLAAHQVVDQHVGAYLKYKSRTCRVTTLRTIAAGIAMVFEEMKDTLGIAENPVLTGLVDSYLRKLQRQRRERAAQMDPIREVHYQAVMASVRKALAGERSGRAELRAALVVAFFSVMFDGMLRVGEAAEARWGDVSPRSSDGSGRLYLPSSKTDQFGIGDYVYLSRRSMVALDQLKNVRRIKGVVKSGDDRIFQVGPVALLDIMREACAAAGLEGNFGTHSFRIGMAQELTVAGFGLVLIMLAGRWGSPTMPAYYTRELDVAEGAVAQLHRVWAQGGDRVIGDMRGIDVLSTYDFVRLVG